MSTTTAPPQDPRPAAADDADRRRSRAPAPAVRHRASTARLLRIGVKTKGCSGLSYDMTWTDAPGPGRRGGQGQGGDGAGRPQGDRCS